ncbi:excisionase family DNA-binding protein [Nocardia sp. NPDC088792]|uniref:excisionase family DNA-binding protein n=1 Tax=Nocardia sp. NPDC088792 TaxID=3364332 RepID=UPI003814ABB5
MKAKTVDGLVSTKQAGEMIGVSPQTIRNWIHAGRLTGFRVGPQRFRLDAEELPKAVEVIQKGYTR